MTGYWGPAEGMPGLLEVLQRAARYPAAVVLLTVVCPRDHALARVLDTGEVPTLVWDDPVATSVDGEAKRLSRAVVSALTLDAEPETSSVHATCRCGTGLLQVADVEAAVAARPRSRRLRVGRHNPRAAWTVLG